MFYTTTELSPHKGKTPEGFLVCRDVVLCRTGLQIYHVEDKLPIDPGPDGYIKVERSPEEVFRPETIASGEGKPLCDDHPEEDVTPANYSILSRGHMQNLRRGANGVDEDLLFGDFFITHPDAIKFVEDNEKTQISLGYDAKYKKLGPGHASQYDILINHAAFVKSARCGPRCSVRDYASRVTTHDAADCGVEHRHADTRPCGCEGGRKMKLSDYITKAFRARDAAEVAEIERQAAADPELETGGNVRTEADRAGTHVHIHRHDGRDVRRGDNGGEGGGGSPGEEMTERLASLERMHEEMRADQQETNDMLDDLLSSEEGGDMDSRRRIMDRIRDRRRGRDNRDNRDARDRRARDEAERLEEDRRRMHSDTRRSYADMRKYHDELAEGERDPEYEEEGRELDSMSRDLEREDCTMDSMRKHSDSMKKMKDRRDARARDAEEKTAETEKELENEAPTGAGDKARKARDSQYLDESWQETITLAEIIAPGQSFPTFDAAAIPSASLARIQQLRSRTLDLAAVNPALRGFLDDASGGDYSARASKMTPSEKRALFRSVAGEARRRNNNQDTGGRGRTADQAGRPGPGGLIAGPKNLAEYQKSIDEFWTKQRAGA